MRTQTAWSEKTLNIFFRVETYFIVYFVILTLYSLNFPVKFEERRSMIISGGIYFIASIFALLILKKNMKPLIPGWGILTLGSFMHFLSTIFDVAQDLKNLEVNIIAIGAIFMLYGFLKVREEILHRAEMLEREKRVTENLNNILRIINKILRHDISNHLTVASAFIEIAAEECDESEGYKEAMKNIERAINTIKRMRELEMLAAKCEFKNLNLREVIEEVSKSCPINVEISGDCTVFADDALYSVFDNLFMNAYKHGKASKVEVTVEEKDGFCEVRVADNGVGIPDEIKDKVFDEGFTTGGGSGLGLYIVKKVIERYNGKIWLEKKENYGAVFVMTLPKR